MYLNGIYFHNQWFGRTVNCIMAIVVNNNRVELLIMPISPRCSNRSFRLLWWYLGISVHSQDSIAVKFCGCIEVFLLVCVAIQHSFLKKFAGWFASVSALFHVVFTGTVSIILLPLLQKIPFFLTFLSFHLRSLPARNRILTLVTIAIHLWSAVALPKKQFRHGENSVN